MYNHMYLYSNDRSGIFYAQSVICQLSFLELAANVQISAQIVFDFFIFD